MKVKQTIFRNFHSSKPVYLLVRLLLIVECTLLFGNQGHAQTKYLSGNYWIENYGKKEGLPESVIIDIMQDRKGYMWITTPYSLVRFDGYQFKVFSPHKQFPDLYIHFSPGLMEDAGGIIWMATNGKGLFRFDPATQKFSRFFAEATTNPLSNNYVSTIIQDDNVGLWVGTANGLNLLSKNSDSISIKKFNTANPERLLKALDKILLQTKAFAGFAKVGDDEKKSATIEIKEATKLFIACMGEISNGVADYGWIENDKGTRIWTMDDAKCVGAGGASKNRLQLDVITLAPGKYKICYQTDDSHSWNKWNEPAPDRPDLWGIQLFKADSKLTDSIEILIKSVFENQSLHGAGIKALLKNSKNYLWALTDAGLEKLDIQAASKNKITSEKIALPPNFYPTSYLLELDSNRLIMEGFIYNPQNKKTTIGSLIYDHTKKAFQLNAQEFLTYSPQNSKGFIRDKHHNYWMASFSNEGDGLYISDEGGEVPVFKKLDLTLPELREAGKPGYDQIWSTYEDRSGYIWVGTRGNGLFKIKTRKPTINYTPITIPGSDTTKLIFNQIKEDAAGNIWLRTKDKGIFKYNSKNKQVAYFTTNDKTQPNPFIYNANESGLAISENNQTKQYAADKAAFKSLSIKVPDTLKLVTIDDNGNYWAVSKKAFMSQEHFFVFNGKEFQPLSFDSSMPRIAFYRNFHIGRNGNVWISPAFEGVQQYELDKQTKNLHFVKRYLPEGVDVYDIYEDKKGIVWLGTYDDGLIRLDPKTNSFKSFSRNEGAPSNFILKIVPINNKFWIIGDVGTAFFNIETQTFSTNKELDDYIQQKTGGASFNSFNDYGFSDHVVKTQSGEIAFIAKNGFCIFNPDDIPLDTVKPIVQISRLLAGGQPIEFEKAGDITGLTLKYNQNNLEIEYIGLHYDQPAKNKYSYLLKGANKDWVLAGTERIARYSNLPPGDYEFYLMAASADGIWSNSKKMFAFTVLPPWWKTWWAYCLYTLFIAAAIRSFIAYRSRQLKKENLLLEAKVERRTAELNESFENLKATQTQLIQSEKMASLGELTAGIAHEIQNPLNFVNNFSEVNTELIEELESEMDKGNMKDAKIIANNIKENEQKINHHGKRADAIVKNMLQHSRSASAAKELTNINALADEYLRLSYHGLRAKDKSFNATIKSDFDETIGNINIVPQDIGRVLLNLYNNAFYATNEKSKQHIESYEPTVSVNTKKVGGNIEIAVTDNGNGIPKKVVDKIFQPFFTTKPTGQGTGLGLSLSYDIIKAHGGEIKVETKEGEGTTFIVILPLNQHT